MNNFMSNVKQLRMNKFIKYILQLIISTSSATLEVPSLRPFVIHIYFCYRGLLLLLYNLSDLELGYLTRQVT